MLRLPLDLRVREPTVTRLPCCQIGCRSSIDEFCDTRSGACDGDGQLRSVARWTKRHSIDVKRQLLKVGHGNDLKRGERAQVAVAVGLE